MWGKFFTRHNVELTKLTRLKKSLHIFLFFEQGVLLSVPTGRDEIAWGGAAAQPQDRWETDPKP